MQFAIRFLFLIAAVLCVLPFVVSSILIDQRGVILSGHVVSKSEQIVVRYAAWSRKVDLTVRYDPPDESMAGFLTEGVSLQQFDSLKKGDAVQLHYLLEKNFPHFPGEHTLRQMHVIPRARLADRNAWSGFSESFRDHQTVTVAVLTAAIILLLWRLLRIPLFGWALATCTGIAVALSFVAEFPKPMPPPLRDVRTAAGNVKSLETIKWLFRFNQNRGMVAEQPVQIAGVEFIPEGRTEPVVAVDLIDEGSVQRLQEHSPVEVEYEAASPRVAYVRGATRHFVQRNLQGIVTQGVAIVLITIVCVGAVRLFGKGVRRLTQRRLN